MMEFGRAFVQSCAGSIYVGTEDSYVHGLSEAGTHDWELILHTRVTPLVYLKTW
jgi:hypothetical protein